MYGGSFKEGQRDLYHIILTFHTNLANQYYRQDPKLPIDIAKACQSVMMNYRSNGTIYNWTIKKDYI